MGIIKQIETWESWLIFVHRYRAYYDVLPYFYSLGFYFNFVSFFVFFSYPFTIYVVSYIFFFNELRVMPFLKKNCVFSHSTFILITFFFLLLNVVTYRWLYDVVQEARRPLMVWRTNSLVGLPSKLFERLLWSTGSNLGSGFVVWEHQPSMNFVNLGLNDGVLIIYIIPLCPNLQM